MSLYTYNTITSAQAAGYNAAADDLVFDDYTTTPGVVVDEAAQTITVNYTTYGAGMFGETIGFLGGTTLVFGTMGADVLRGTAVYGAGGADTLQGAGGQATLDGGSGDDRLIGSHGADQFTGGSGSDTFVILPGDSPATDDPYNRADTITDWQVSDRLAFTVGSTGSDYVELQLTTRSFAEARAAADAQIASGAANFVAVEMVMDGVSYLYLYADSKQDNGGADDVVYLGKHTLADISSANIVGGAARVPNDVGVSLVGSNSDDRLAGTSGDDTIFGYDGSDSITGGAGADSLSGNAGSNVLRGGAGTDVLEGDGFKNYYVFDAGDSSASAGRFDVIKGWSSQSKLVWGQAATATDYTEITAVSYLDAVNKANALIASGTYNYVAVSVHGSDVYLFVDSRGDDGTADDAVKLENTSIYNIDWTNIVGPASLPAPPPPSTVVNGTPGDDTLSATSINTTVNGGAGNDLLISGPADDYLDGGVTNGAQGNDTASYANATGGVTVSLAVGGPQTVGGGLGVDTLHNINGLIGGAYNDRLTASYGYNTIWGGAGSDTISNTTYGGNTGSITFYGEDGNDVLTADTGGAILLSGGNGADTLTATAGWISPTLLGGAGDDRLTSTSGNLMGEDGSDTLSSTSAARLDGGAGADSITGGYSGNTLIGGEGADTLVSDSSRASDYSGGANYLDAGGGDDKLIVHGGHNTVLAGDGADTIISDGSPFAGNGSSIDGGAGYDHLTYVGLASMAIDLRPGHAGTDTVSGVEWVTGGSYSDTLTGSDGVDTLEGGAGADLISGGGGDDLLDGGPGLDTVTFAGATSGVTVNLGVSGPQAVGGGQGVDTITGFENLIGSAFDDTLTLGASGGKLVGGAGSDRLIGGAGADVFYVRDGVGPAGADTISGGAGDRVEFGVDITGRTYTDPVSVDLSTGHAHVGADDIVLTGISWVTGTLGGDSLVGGDAGETLSGGRGADVIAGQGGDDFIQGDGSSGFSLVTDGPNALSGGDGNDTIQGGGGQNGILGDGGSDSLVGGVADDLIQGGDGNDTLSSGGGAGYDDLEGGAGNDSVSATGYGDSYLRGDSGADTISGGYGFDDINGNMGDDVAHGGYGDDWVVGGKDQDQLYGDSGDDIVYGNLGNDTCDGGDGADLVRGGQGNDVITGGAGNDWLSGDRGDDTITGGAGADTFHAFQDSGIDRVLDFNYAEGDRVQLDAGTTYTVSQVGADTVLTMGPGHQMILVGVQLSTLQPGWVFGA